MRDDAAARAARARGDLALAQGRRDDASVAWSEAMALAETPGVVGEIWMSRAWLAPRDRAGLADQALGEAAAAFEAAGDPSRRATALQARANLRLERAHAVLHPHHAHGPHEPCDHPEPASPPGAAVDDDLLGALADAEAAVRCAGEADARLLAVALATRAAALRFTGRERPSLGLADAIARAEADLDAAIAAFLGVDDAMGAALLASTEAERRRAAGDHPGARRYLEVALALPVPGPLRASALAVQVELLGADGQTGQARALAREAERLLGALPNPPLRARLSRWSV